MANDCIPYYEPGADLTAHCEAAVIGKRFVAISDPVQNPIAGLASTAVGGNIVVSLSGADDVKTIGVAAYDAAIGKKVGVKACHGIVVPVTASANIATGALVTSDAVGKAIEAADNAAIILGICLTAALSGADAMILFNPQRNSAAIA